MPSFFETRSEVKKRSLPKQFGKKKRAGKVASTKDFKILQERGCDGCPLLTEDVEWSRMKPTGDTHPILYMLGEAPGKEEDDIGIQFVGKAGRYFRSELKQAGLDKILTRWDNCCRCRPPDNRTPEREGIERCRLRIQRSIERARPPIVVAVGGTSLLQTLGESTITKWRGKLVPAKIGNHVCWVYPILHPSYIQRNYGEDDWSLVFETDLKRLAKIVDDIPKPSIEEPSYYTYGLKYATDRSGLLKLARQIETWDEEKAVVAFDIETIGLRPYNTLPPRHGILSIAFSDGNITWAMPLCHKESGWIPDDWQLAHKLVERFITSNCLKVAHNLGFEMEWLTTGRTKPLKRKGWGDTEVQSYILDERLGTHDLDTCCLHRFGFRLKAFSNVDRENLANLDRESLLKYNALDAKYTARLFYIQREELKAEGLLDTYKMHIRRCITLVKTQQKGLVVDFDTVTKLQRKLSRKINSLLINIASSPEAIKYEEKTGLTLNPASNEQLTVLFRDMLGRSEGNRKKNKTGYSVDEKALSAMKIPMADKILVLRTAQKQKTTYVDSCVAKGGLVAVDGRLHTNFKDTVTVTGRLSSSDPNVQNMPAREDAWIRAMITTPKTNPKTGASCRHIIFSADYGQIEPRVIAMASRDKTLCKAIREKYDIHLDWAEKIAKIDSKCFKNHKSDIKALRQDVKSNWVLAGFYGAEYDSIAARVGITTRKGEELFEQFKETFSGVWRWQDEQISFYNENGYVQSLTGRRRRAPLSINQILNNPTQGVASDIVVGAMNRLSIKAEREDEPAFQPILNLHDDISFYLPKRHAEELGQEIVEEMLRPVFDWMIVPISVETAIGDNWAEMKKQSTFYSDDIYE